MTIDPFSAFSFPCFQRRVLMSLEKIAVASPPADHPHLSGILESLKRTGEFPDFGQNEAYLTIPIQSIGSQAPFTLTIGGNVAQVEEEFEDAAAAVEIVKHLFGL